MAIEFIPKKEYKASVEKTSFFIVLVILVASIVFSGFLYFSNQKKENIKVDLENQINQLQNQENENLENKILFKKIQLDNAKILLKNHKFLSRIFEFIENNLLKSIKVIKLNASLNENELIVEMDGVVDEFKDISLQEIHFKDRKEIKNLVITSINKENRTKKLIFSLVLTFEDDFLNYKEKQNGI